MCYPKSSVPCIPWSCGRDGWLTDQLLNGGLTTGFYDFIYVKSKPSTPSMIRFLKPKSSFPCIPWAWGGDG